MGKLVPVWGKSNMSLQSSNMEGADNCGGEQVGGGLEGAIM